MFRTAFTMLELVFVIVVIAILASLAIPRMERDFRREARSDIITALRYTQHLALIDDKLDISDSNWQRKLWKISFATSTLSNRAFFYTISSDRNNNGHISKSECAIDPANGKYMYNNNGDTTIHSDESPNIFIGKNFGINSISFAGGCTAQHIAFDNFGRPYSGITTATNDHRSYMRSDCHITFGFATDSIEPLTVTIAQETGAISAN